MDVTAFLFKTISQLAMAMTGLAFAVITWIIGKMTRQIATKAHSQPQQQASSAPAKTKQAPRNQATPQPPTPPGTTPAPNVHVPPQTAVQTTPEPAPPVQSHGNRPTPSVLSQPDHRIYVTTGSDLMMEHPACDALLEHLDHMLYVAAHRDGEPFKIGSGLDDSPGGTSAPLELPPPLAVEQCEFLSEEGRPLPPPDGALWIRREGRMPEQLPANGPS